MVITEKHTAEAQNSPKNATIKHRSGKELIDASRFFAKEDRSKSWYKLLSTLSLMIASFLITFFVPILLVKIPLAILTGLFMVRSFVIYHDYMHRAILQQSKVAEAIMTIFGLFILAPTTIWKRSHDHHHQHNSKLSLNGVGSYPLCSKEEFNQLSKGEQALYIAMRHPLTILFGYVALFLVDFSLKTFILSPKKHWDSIVAFILHIGMAYFISTQLGFATMLIVWILPFIIADAMGAYLFYAQHNFPSATFAEGKEWNYTGAAIESTSFLKMGPIMNWFTGNIGYHHVHHLNHHIPFYRLPEAMAGIPELQSPKITTLAPKEIWACLRLKVWDSEARRMTPLN